jgi:hypothetical protein
MAKTRFETKKGIPVWAILAALIVLALIAWAIWSLHYRGHQNEIDHVAQATSVRIFVLESQQNPS